MRIKRLFCVLILSLFLVPVNTTFASAQDFYFEDFTADYYLTKLEDGTSNLHVKEVLTAVFPETDQNHGITRTIPYTNRGGKNITIENAAAMNLEVLRNGESENVGKIVNNDGYFTVYIGDANKYVHGRQIYTLEYDYKDVITEFDANGNNVSGIDGVKKVLQELYWDTNGTDWQQSFGRVTANLHTTADIHSSMDKKAWCYVGKYGENDQGRCRVIAIDDGFSFTVEDLDAHENLTFVVEFAPNTFEIVVTKNYALVAFLITEIILMTIIIMAKYSKWKRNAKLQYDLYKSLFVAPQYLPPENKNICVAEGEQIYIKRTESSYVATLLELAVSKKVTIKKVEGKEYNWSVVVNVEPDQLTEPQKQMMNILSGDGNFRKGDEILIKKHKPTKYLASCVRDYREKATEILRGYGYLKDDTKTIKNSTGLSLIWVIFLMPVILQIATGLGVIYMRNMNSNGGDEVMVGAKILPILIFGILILTIVVSIILGTKEYKYARYTEDGIRLVKHLEGLELYVNMAEKDRLNFLQSVEGADVSNKGIVKLYEKVLPWASLFGAEDSWVRELEKYYKIEDAGEALDSDILNVIIASDITHDINNIILSSTSYASSGSSGSSGSILSGGDGGSWSSSDSGGGSFSSGGGGFSGGGGGGGGGGGW